MKRVIALSALVLSCAASSARADLNVEMGTGAFSTRDTGYVLAGYSMPASPVFGIRSYHEVDVGAWTGTRSATIVGVAKGLKFQVGESFECRLSTGGSLISHTNDRVSTPFEFYEQVMLRYLTQGTEMAVSYRHWSNADMKAPNLGMDFIGVQVKMGF